MRTRTSSTISSILAATLTAMIAATLFPAPAAAFWSVTSTSSSAGAAATGAVNPGSTPAVTVSDRNTITISWDRTTLSNGAPVSGYRISRYDSANVPQQLLGNCTGTVTATECTEPGVPDGLWTYTVTPLFLTNWTGSPSSNSPGVRTDIAAPFNAISRTAVSGASFLSGTTVFYRGIAAGSFRLSNAVTDAGSGAGSSTTGVLSGTTTGWAHTPSAVSSPSGGPFVSNLFSWAASTTTQPTIGIAGQDIAGNTIGSTLAFVLDNTGPTGGAITYANGYTSATTVPITLSPISDAGAGNTSGGSRYLQRATAILDGNVCGTFSSFTNHITNPLVSPEIQLVTVENGSCYQYRYLITDNLGNRTVTTSTASIKARNYETIIANTPGLLSHWRLADTTTVIDDIRPANNNGTYFNSPTQGVAGAIIGDANTAVTFDGANDYAQVTRQISNDFSIEFWFKSTQGRGTGNNWYDGAGLVDAELGGVANDFGIALMANGRVAAGTGNPDTTISSERGFNDGAWHHVVMTRTQTNGDVRLYVDGDLSATGTGSTRALASATTMSFGQINTGMNLFAGSLDEIATYTTILTPTQISNHNLSGR
ncbi:LamG domain-containing protein [Cryobacterium sp. M15]|jgi:hypothetical protein|uniref:LamG domain-containing protein n=1 Tax=Cryobacterium sp. M15 TaxID=2048291 RepID=UPI000CE49B37|nr:LamG domain-containing protein [Cryobacterium sp. M15]